MRILVAEDDTRLAAVLQDALTEVGWDVDLVHDGTAALHGLLGGTDHDVALLDWNLPGTPGVEVSRRLRTLGVTTPILMLTARSSVRDRIDGLDAGADDYLPKPFDLDELLARLRALRRRSTLVGEAPLLVGDLHVDPASRRVHRGYVEVTLSTRELDILILLAQHAGEVVSRLAILDAVWDGDTDLRSNVIDVHVAGIRAKIDKPFGLESITTLRGIGFRLDPRVTP